MTDKFGRSFEKYIPNWTVFKDKIEKWWEDFNLGSLDFSNFIIYPRNPLYVISTLMSYNAMIYSARAVCLNSNTGVISGVSRRRDLLLFDDSNNNDNLYLLLSYSDQNPWTAKMLQIALAAVESIVANPDVKRWGTELLVDHANDIADMGYGNFDAMFGLWGFGVSRLFDNKITSDDVLELFINLMSINWVFIGVVEPFISQMETKALRSIAPEVYFRIGYTMDSELTQRLITSMCNKLSIDIAIGAILQDEDIPESFINIIAKGLFDSGLSVVRYVEELNNCPFVKELDLKCTIQKYIFDKMGMVLKNQEGDTIVARAMTLMMQIDWDTGSYILTELKDFIQFVDLIFQKRMSGVFAEIMTRMSHFKRIFGNGLDDAISDLLEKISEEDMNLFFYMLSSGAVQVFRLKEGFLIRLCQKIEKLENPSDQFRQLKNLSQTVGLEGIPFIQGIPGCSRRFSDMVFLFYIGNNMKFGLFYDAEAAVKHRLPELRDMFFNLSETEVEVFSDKIDTIIRMVGTIPKEMQKAAFSSRRSQKAVFIDSFQAFLTSDNRDDSLEFEHPEELMESMVSFPRMYNFSEWKTAREYLKKKGYYDILISVFKQCVHDTNGSETNPDRLRFSLEKSYFMWLEPEIIDELRIDSSSIGLWYRVLTRIFSDPNYDYPKYTYSFFRKTLYAAVVKNFDILTCLSQSGFRSSEKRDEFLRNVCYPVCRYLEDKNEDEVYTNINISAFIDMTYAELNVTRAALSTEALKTIVSSEQRQTIRIIDSVPLAKLGMVKKYMSPEFKRLTYYPRRKAERYNAEYDGIFLHSTPSLGSTLDIISKNSGISDFCVSTVRASTVYRSGSFGIGNYDDNSPEDFKTNHLNFPGLILGLGKIDYLFDFDAYTYRQADGKRYATASLESEETEDLTYQHDAQSSNIHCFDPKQHYDEGIMNINTANICVVVVDNVYVKTAKSLIDKIMRKVNYYYEVWPYSKFERLLNSDDLHKKLLEIHRKDHILALQDEDHYEEYNDVHNYRESFNFSDYMVLKEEKLGDINIDKAYEIFKKEYEASTGKSWDYWTFASRAQNWNFYGDDNGYVAVRKQRSGFLKLVEAAGSGKSKFKALKEIVALNEPLCGMVSKDLRDILVRMGLRSPNMLERTALKLLFKTNPVLGQNIKGFTNDNGVIVNVGGLGETVKYFVASEKYYKEMKNMPIDTIKNIFKGIEKEK